VLILWQLLTWFWGWYEAYMYGGGGGRSWCGCLVNGLPPGGPAVGIISGPGPRRQSGTESVDIKICTAIPNHNLCKTIFALMHYSLQCSLTLVYAIVSVVKWMHNGEFVFVHTFNFQYYATDLNKIWHLQSTVYIKEYDPLGHNTM
jgi:hypothetical protein